MDYQTVFKRHEMKYLLTRDQKRRILETMVPHMKLDKFGRTTIRNIYYDTDDYILARHSIAKPEFKEKLRVRSYEQAGANSTVFVELKRKYDKVVFKRRVPMQHAKASSWLAAGHIFRESYGTADGMKGSDNTQMTAEIEYFVNYYKSLKPVAFLSYEREAFRMRTDDDTASRDFRVTFDENMVFRDYDLSLESGVYGHELIDTDMTLMEIKCSAGMPLWMAEILSELKVYKTSFSKYGTAYTSYILPSVAARKSQWEASPSAEPERSDRRRIVRDRSSKRVYA